MIDEIKGMFSEKLVPTLIVLGVGLVAGVVIGVFTPVKNWFNGRRR